MGRRASALQRACAVLSQHVELLPNLKNGLGPREAATIAYETVCSKPQQADSGSCDKPTVLVVHGLLGSG